MSWEIKSIIAMLMLVPAWLSIPLFKKHVDVNGDVFLVWYMLAVSLSIGVYLGPKQVFSPGLWPIVGMLLVGVISGAIGNMLLFNAVGEAPNPGLPVSIANASAVIVFVASVALFKLSPSIFPSVQFNLSKAAGVIITLVGIFLIVRK